MVDFERLRADLQALSRIGLDESDRGIYRMAFTDADMEARRFMLGRLEEAGIAARMDEAGNVIGRHAPDGTAGQPAVLIGSHLDSVPCGGTLDGALGVIVGLECVRRIAELGLPLARPVEVVGFADEEGRFGGLFGSSAMAGQLNSETIHTATDLGGERLIDAMARHDLDAMDALLARRRADEIEAYLELHIEQGPVLDRTHRRLGVVDEITGLAKWAVRLMGNPDHAGTTPMPMRRDAFGGLAEFVGEIPRILEEHGGEDSVATVGSVTLFPGTANTVPGRVDFSLDLRDTDAGMLRELGDAVRRALSAIARRRQLMFEFDVISEVEPVRCDDEIIGVIDAATRALDVEAHRMPSGAAHDAQIMARLTRVGMIFVPSADGRSHSPSEWTHWEDIELGANVALGALARLAGRTP